MPKLLQAADCFLFPSVWEGFGMVAVEAQTAGLPCVCSDVVPQSVKVIEDCVFMATDNAKKWAEQALSFTLNRSLLSRDTFRSVIDYGFDIKESSSKLVKFYQVNWSIA